MRISGGPVTKNGELVGVVSMEDLIRSLYTNNVDAPVTEFMTADVITVRSTDPVVEALKVFVNTGVWTLARRRQRRQANRHPHQRRCKPRPAESAAA